jgi:rhodanese-related sulfurtransferase
MVWTCGCLLVLASFASVQLMRDVRAGQQEYPGPWTSAQLVQPPDLARELANAKGANRPMVVFVGVRALFEGAHVPGAVFHGPGMSEQGLADLKTWAQNLPRSSNIVIYCGCCPWNRCPNVRPAFLALRDMGFKRLRALVIPTNLSSDWIAKGYPVEKGR